MDTLKITAYTDPLCSWCYGQEPALTALGFASCAPRRARLSAEEQKARDDSLRVDSIMRAQKKILDSLERQNPPVKLLYGVRPAVYQEKADNQLKSE